ncbi:MAG: DUF559 domain-containing protein [bacterium]|nr:DUF559 domain-containing protein [bacterium]
MAPSRRLRKDQTRHEKKLWRFLRDRQVGGFKFRRQYVIDSYIVDFCCVEKRVMIEVDGGGHGEELQGARDQTRDEFLIRQGWQVLRIWNSDVDENLEGVMEQIWQLTVSPSPQPSPQWEREKPGPHEKNIP